jgi:hypothetical protein
MVQKPIEQTKKVLPTLQELHYDEVTAFQHDQFNLLLNQPVPEAWVKEHPFAKNVKYLPIDKVEFLLTRIFQNWKVEVISYSALFNSVSVHIRLHLQHPLTGDWIFHDGLGAVGVQTDKGASASDLSAIKQDAIMKALPAAESYAIKDAAEKLGIFFGKNLNRKDTIGFAGAYSKEDAEPTDDKWQELQELYNVIEDNLTEDEKINAERILKTKEINSYKKLLKQLKNKIK